MNSIMNKLIAVGLNAIVVIFGLTTTTPCNGTLMFGNQPRH